MSALHTRPVGAQPASVRRPRVTRWLVRIVATGHLAAVLAQPMLAGLYLNGDYDVLAAHQLNGSLLPLSSMLLGAVAVAYFVAGGVGWPVLAVAGLWLAEGLQIGTGYAQELAIHIPLGVAITVTAVLLAGWTWFPAAARPRRRYRAGPGGAR